MASVGKFTLNGYHSGISFKEHLQSNLACKNRNCTSGAVLQSSSMALSRQTILEIFFQECIQLLIFNILEICSIVFMFYVLQHDQNVFDYNYTMIMQTLEPFQCKQKVCQNKLFSTMKYFFMLKFNYLMFYIIDSASSTGYSSLSNELLHISMNYNVP